MNESKNVKATPKQVEQLQLAARLAVQVCLKGDQNFFSSADMCNLHELALAGLGYIDDHPQVPLEEIEEYVKEKLGDSNMPREIE